MAKQDFKLKALGWIQGFYKQSGRRHPHIHLRVESQGKPIQACGRFLHQRDWSWAEPRAAKQCSHCRLALWDMVERCQDAKEKARLEALLGYPNEPEIQLP